ncbi:MAG: hypothetical protein CMJ31_02395 [Phycisphaerae bacterium]|nr:hypothetical protein [Phycisphaerae bacterium]
MSLAFDKLTLTSLILASLGGSATGRDGMVNVDFALEESETFEGPGVLGSSEDDLFWNREVPGFGDPYYLGGWLEADGATESNLRIALRITGRSRRAPAHPIFQDWLSGRTSMDGPSELLFVGLTPGEAYDVALYANGEGGAVFVFGGDSKSTSGQNRDSFSEGENYVVFRGLIADSSGDIAGTIDDNPFDTEPDTYSFNGFQIVPSNATSGGACAADVNADGDLDIADVVGFLRGFGDMDEVADIAVPFGSWDIADVTAFLEAFGAGCP